jgi:hypothetical protein
MLAQRHDGDVEQQALVGRTVRHSGIRESVAPSGASRSAAVTASTKRVSKTSLQAAAERDVAGTP